MDLLLLVFLLVWIVAGIAALITSIMCFGASGSTSDKVIGLVIYIFLGPFYWLYYAANKKYCR